MTIAAMTLPIMRSNSTGGVRRWVRLSIIEWIPNIRRMSKHGLQYRIIHFCLEWRRLLDRS